MTAGRPGHGSWSGRRCGSERGAATVQVLMIACLLVMIGCALGAVGGLVVAHRRAQAAADLAALAGARALMSGAEPCSEAARVARLNGATVRGCSMQAADVLVEVTVTGPQWWGRPAQLAARARAGPASRSG